MKPLQEQLLSEDTWGDVSARRCRPVNVVSTFFACKSTFVAFRSLRCLMQNNLSVNLLRPRLFCQNFASFQCIEEQARKRAEEALRLSTLDES